MNLEQAISEMKRGHKITRGDGNTMLGTFEGDLFYEDEDGEIIWDEIFEFSADDLFSEEWRVVE